MWSPDGKAIYYRFEGNMMRVPVIAAQPFQAGLPAVMFGDMFNLRSDTGISYQPHPHDARFLMTRPADVTTTSSIRLIPGWFDELRKIR